MSIKVNYIVANYIGPLRYSKLDSLFFFKEHLNFLKNIKTDIKIFPTFVFNEDVDSQIKKELDGYSEYDILYRKNSGYSYGAWNDVIIKNINNYNYDYFFLIEDDYIPTCDNFLNPFLDRCKGDTIFVCGLVEEASSVRFPSYVQDNQKSFKFPSISNGLIPAGFCRFFYKKNKKLFNISMDTDKDTAYKNQIYFCKYFTDMGYKITDILDEFKSPFFDSKNIVTYGNENRLALLKPIEIKL